jgi:excinuclease ABC subunit B
MQEAIAETDKRRALQSAFNRKHNITPLSIQKNIQDILASVYEIDYHTIPTVKEQQKELVEPKQISQLIKELKKRMREAASRLEFEEAAELRDRIKALQEEDLLWK